MRSVFLTYAATRCDTLQHTATHCSTLQHTATHCNTLQHTRFLPTHGVTTISRLPELLDLFLKEKSSVLQCVAVCCSVSQVPTISKKYLSSIQGSFWTSFFDKSVSKLPCVAVCCSVLQCVAVFCSVLQCVAVCSQSFV